jgi:hypothetical protein
MPLDLRNAEAFTPPELPISGMPPVVGAGVKLARLVLCIAAGSIVLLVAYLVFMDLVIARDVSSAYKQVAAAGVVNAQVAGESAGKINEQRVAMHAFWIQAAQLILLNLLLPLLTALFGYIFGTQQAQRTQ